MALTPAEKQRRYRERQRKRIQELAADIEPVDRPADAAPAVIDKAPKRLRDFYRPIDAICDKVDVIGQHIIQTKGIDQGHIDHAVYKLAEAEKTLRTLRLRLQNS